MINRCDCTARELDPSGITVNSVTPGLIDTDITGATYDVNGGSHIH